MAQVFLPTVVGSVASYKKRTYWNPSDKSASIALTNDGLTAADSSGASVGVRGVPSHTTTGKYYFEVSADTVNTTNGRPYIGIVQFTFPLGGSFNQGPCWMMAQDGSLLDSGSSKSAGITFTTGDIIGVAVDLGANNIWWAKNNAWVLSGNPGAGTNPTWTNVTGAVYPYCCLWSNQSTARFASSAWSYAAPSGFSAW